MNAVPVRELCNNTANVVARVRAGEPLMLTSRGEPVAELRPVPGGTRPFMTWAEAVAIPKFDSGFKQELDEIYNDLTDSGDCPGWFGNN